MALGGGSAGTSGSASPNAIKAGEAFVELSANDSKLQKTLMGVIGKIKRAGVMIRQVGLGATAAGLTILAPLIGATKVFANFDDQMRMVKAVTQSNNDQFERLNVLAKKLGQSTSFTAAQVAGLMVELGKGGFNVDQIEAITASILDLSRASGTDATLSAEIFVATMNQFGLSAKDAKRIVDVLTLTANKSAISVADLGESFSYAATDISNLGLSIEDAGALVGVLGNLGIKGSSAGTAIRRLGLILASQPEKIKKAFNVDTADAQGNLRPIVDILDEIFQVTGKMGSADRAKAMADVFGVLTITAASGLGKSTNSIKDFAESLRGANGVAADTAKEMDAGIGGTFRRLRGVIEGTVIAIGDALSPTLIELGTYITPIIKSLIDLIKSNKEVVVGVMLFGVGLTAAGLALAAFGFAISGIMAGITALGTIIGTIFSPFVLTLTAIVALIGVIAAEITLLAGTFDDIGPTLSSMGETFKQTWGGILEAIKAGDLSKAMEIGWLGIKIVWEQGILFLIKTWKGLKKTFGSLFGDIIYLLKDLWSSFVVWVQNKIYDVLAFFARNMKAIADELGIDSGLMSEEEINKYRDKLKRDNEADRLKRMRQLQKDTENLGNSPQDKADIARQEALIAKMQGLLAELVKKKVEAEVAIAPPPRAVQQIQEQTKMSGNLMRLADSVRGAFSSSNYAGAFGIGGKNELEKQTGLLKSIDKKLDKLDVPTWE